MMDKNTFRKMNRAKRDQMSEEESQVKSSAILEQLLKLPDFMLADDLFTYVSFGKEVNTHELIKSALLFGKRVYVPKVLDKKFMEFYQIEGLEELLPGTLGILEPEPKKLGQMQNERKQIMIVPGLAFDLIGNRIGFGAGYYDRYFIEHPNPNLKKVAIAYDFQIEEELPADQFDIPMQRIVTEKRQIRI
ncbi:MAG TPA: 5-formyltetrahydrofolate cyclo-ligase [Lachnoclostridium phytofermentans]|uniref:5-formyltetrahydrofolate cyclo-ligase n=1 Tax=Lachnoclostridium phytofermentans TaxID=66219 RepID=A0A3D2X986_9FIRM|nr:5-formyltetrahydrofolate cyclo-ligase [Lachnoclostridium sp.]HCL03709.1 5-formyltetrahydrofolate cyclo-ligase [Lachnoclostridium phytofermentans]